MSPRARNRLLFAAKALFAAGLLTWLVRSGALNFGALGILVKRPALFALNFVVFAGCTLLVTLRWRALLHIAEVRIPFWRAFQLQMTALFFNVVIPGSVGGDVVKSLYVARGEAPQKRTLILLIVFVERLIGLAGLVLLASIVILTRGLSVFADTQLRQLAMAVGALGLLTVLGPLFFMFVMHHGGGRLDQWTRGTTRLAGLLNRLVTAARLLVAGPKQLAMALALSMVSHGIVMVYFTALTRLILDQDVPYSAIATIFPLGILTLVLPISPSGLGVGHMAFERLFQAIGLESGATIFNVYLLGQIAPCILGVFPYLTLRSQGALPTDAEAANGEVSEAKVETT